MGEPRVEGQLYAFVDILALVDAPTAKRDSWDLR